MKAIKAPKSRIQRIVKDLKLKDEGYIAIEDIDLDSSGRMFVYGNIPCLYKKTQNYNVRIKLCAENSLICYYNESESNFKWPPLDVNLDDLEPEMCWLIVASSDEEYKLHLGKEKLGEEDDYDSEEENNVHNSTASTADKSTSESLEDKLQKALDREHYEKAARLRDKIRAKEEKK